ncbi:MAG: MMPL family transporter [Candidatus Thalassarchaeaceae archaeon]|jgi:predicted RND superfamily exporter protein|nr:MMPL family transporter [Candidatus Thalassarchaeaceae archaeon]
MRGDDTTSVTLVEADSFERAALPILLISIALTLALGIQLYPLPTFDTDLSAFSPETEAQSAEDRMSAHFPSESRPMFIHITVDNELDSNALSIESLQIQQSVLDELITDSEEGGNYIESVIAAPNILQFALDESDANGTTLSDYNSWAELADGILEQDTICGDALSDDRALSAGSFIQDSLLHNDLNYDPICEYLQDRENYSGDASPSASSTLWVLMISPNLDDVQRQIYQSIIRDNLDKASDNTTLDFHSTSLDLMSYDINKGTLGELAMLIVGALIVVVILLAIAFRSARGVAFPLVGLSAALVWTYGGMALVGVEFSVLEVAVAPVVLGLGIDYSIHLQRQYNNFRADGMSPGNAWLRGFDTLKVALTLGVITTMAAFIANIVSPLPPLRTFGFALAFGVFCAFVSSTVLVGALHVFMERDVEDHERGREWARFGKFSDGMVQIQRSHQAKVIGLVALLTVGSIIFAVARLETEFDLTDFLDEDMDVMQGRTELYDSYDAAGWKPVYILMEPETDATSIPDNGQFLNALGFLDTWLASTQGVVAPHSTGTKAHPAYDGPYPILLEAVEGDAIFGESHHLKIAESKLAKDDNFVGGDIAAALFNLSQNNSLSDPLTGESWSERVSKVIAFNEGPTPSILYIRMEILVEVETSQDSERVLVALTDTVDRFSEWPGVNAEVHISGDMVALQAVLDGLTESQLESTVISLIVSFTVLLALTRRIGPALIIVMPVALAATWVVGAMALLHLNWNVLTVMVTALTIGLGIDYSIHVWKRFEATREKEDDLWAGLKETYASTGVALVLSAGTTICGFAVLLISEMPVVRDFGVVTAITVFFSLILALVLLPTFLLLDSQSKNGTSEDL